VNRGQLIKSFISMGGGGREEDTKILLFLLKPDLCTYFGLKYLLHMYINWFHFIQTYEMKVGIKYQSLTLYSHYKKLQFYRNFEYISIATELM